MSRFTTALLVLLAGALACAPAATAAGKAKPPKASTVTATAVATGPQAIASATATCPGGQRAIGGGFRAPSSIDVVGVVYESVKVGQRSWRASVQLLDIGDPSALTLTTQVNCRARAPRTRAAFTTIPTDGVTGIGPTATARCSPKANAISGGYSMPAPLIDNVATSLVMDSRRSGTGAWATRVATGAAGPSTVTTHVYCAERRKELLERSATGEPTNVDFGPSSSTATCETPRVPFAGGFAQPGSNVESFFVVTESRRVNEGWLVSALHSGRDPAVSLSSFAYCGFAAPNLWRKGRSVGGKLVVPGPQGPEGGPEALLRSLLVK
jgi:hypothetical protein